ncbi:hypothetical protein EVAR_14184_1 [Eumeta japonica]|uniref:RNase H type-1 domain-containing protein n=1 Tax=Eumeta variegata TaxID=151549 RepID=A0A4C1UEH0_EUMVA|nr:hypothetical protein EVAR_14184_1 [Eumeta japonica]
MLGGLEVLQVGPVYYVDLVGAHRRTSASLENLRVLGIDCAADCSDEQSRNEEERRLLGSEAGRYAYFGCVHRTAGNEGADELARNAALKRKTATDYDRFPLSHVKNVISAASLYEWQQRYAEGSTS